MICRKGNKCECTAFNQRFCKNWVPDKPKKSKGQKELFEDIWNTRPHVCWITGDHLPGPAKADYFFHVLPKGGYPKYKLNLDNLILTRSDYHHDWHSKGRSELLEKDPRWQRLFDKYEELKQEYENHN